MIYSRMESATNAAIEVKVNLSEKSKISNLGVARPFLGIEIHRDSNGTGISLGQKTFISMIVKRFHMHHTHRVTTPMVPNLKLDLDDDRGKKELDTDGVKNYHLIVGSSIYTALATRTDISYAVAALCQYNSCPFTSHMTAAKRVPQYLRATADFRLHFNSNGNGNGNCGIVGCTDSDSASDTTDRKSQGGHDGGAISWPSWKQDLITLSISEATYMACSEASEDVRWLLQFQRDIHCSPSDASLLPIYCCNQGAFTHIKTGVIKGRGKHIIVCYPSSRDLHASKIVDYSYVHTNDNVADFLMKPHNTEKNTKFTKGMGLW